MSLVILSNHQQEFVPEDGVEGIQNPNSFHNAMSNTITLPPHTEVGVVSAKIYRQPRIVIQGDSIFHAYFGKLLDQTGGQTLSAVATNVPIPVVLPSGTYNQPQLQIALQTALSGAFGCHPNLFHNGCVVSDSITGALPFPTIGGLAYDVVQTSIATPISPTDATLVVNDISGRDLTFEYLGNALEDDVPNLTYAKATKRITRAIDGASLLEDWDFGGIAMFRDLPVNMSKALTSTRGSFSIDLTNAVADSGFLANEGWRVGFSRPECRTNQHVPDQPSEPDWFDGAEEFYDYMIEYDGDAGLLYMFHAIDTGGGHMEMSPIEYWGADIQAHDGTAWTNQVTTANLITGGGIYNRLNWTFYGEQMTIWLSDNTFGNAKSLMNNGVDGWAQLGLNRSMKPVGTACQTLYPKFDLSTKDQYFTLNNYDCPMPWSKRSGETGGYHFPTKVPLLADGPPPSPNGGSSFWGKAIFSDMYSDLAMESDMCARNTGLGVQIAYVGQDASTTGASALVNGEAIAYGYGLIVASEGSGVGEYTNFAGTGNVRRWLGFPHPHPGNVLSFGGLNPMGTLSDAGGGDPNTGNSCCKWVVNSSQAVDFAPKQLFVKCPSLTHQSFNFCKGLTSKILWSLPRFSNSGTTTGPLFFQQESPIYLSLRNNAPLVINDLQIDFVDKNEQIVEDLGGESVVVLHFRTER